MPFRPIRLLILIDDAGGACATVVPRMKELLEHRAFLVDTHRIQDGPRDIAPYAGLILGTPVRGLALRHAGPTPALEAYVRGLDLSGKKVALFAVYDLRPGVVFDRMKGLIFEQGADFVAAHAYSRWRPTGGEHILPTECMVRIR